MPILPHEVRKQVERKPRPDKMGEEGILHIISLGDERYFAKQWYKNQDTQRAVSPEHGGSPMSPYWHKLKYYEYKLIHEAFPDCTVEMVAGFDARIKKAGTADYTFDMLKGRPTTVTREVVGEEPTHAAVQGVLDQAYRLMLPYREAVRGRPRNDAGEVAFDRVVLQADEAVQSILGKEVHLDKFKSGYTEAEFKRLIAEVCKVNPNSRIIQLLEYGIVPIHPEFNFIPGSPDQHPKPPHGTFIECAIRDTYRFRTAMLGRYTTPEQVAERKQFEQRLNRYMLMRILDQIFEHIIGQPLGPKEAWKFDPKVQIVIFNILESVRKSSEQNQRSLTHHDVRYLGDAVIEKFGRAFSPDHLVILLETEIVKPLRKQLK